MGRAGKSYTVYDNTTDMPIIVSASASECAERMGIKLSTFYEYVSRTNSGKDTKYSILEYPPNADENTPYKLIAPPEKKEKEAMENKEIEALKAENRELLEALEIAERKIQSLSHEIDLMRRDGDSLQSGTEKALEEARMIIVKMAADLYLRQ